MITDKLDAFGIHLKKHVMTTDGASVIKKLSQKSSIFQKMYHSHGIPLAMVYTLYQWPHNLPTDGNEDENEEDEIYKEKKIEESDNEVGSDDDSIGEWVEEQSVNADVQLADNIAELIKKI